MYGVISATGNRSMSDILIALRYGVFNIKFKALLLLATLPLPLHLRQRLFVKWSAR